MVRLQEKTLHSEDNRRLLMCKLEISLIWAMMKSSNSKSE